MILQHNEYCLIQIVKNKDHYISKQYGFTYRHDHGIINETESEEEEEDEEEVSLEDKDINLGQNIPTIQTNEEPDNLKQYELPSKLIHLVVNVIFIIF